MGPAVTLWGHPAVLGQLTWVWGPLEGFSLQGKWAALRLGLTLCPSMSSPKCWGRPGLGELSG